MTYSFESELAIGQTVYILKQVKGKSLKKEIVEGYIQYINFITDVNNGQYCEYQARDKNDETNNSSSLYGHYKWDFFSSRDEATAARDKWNKSIDDMRNFTI